MKHPSRTWTGQNLPYAHVKRDGMFLSVDKGPTGALEFHTSLPTDVTHIVRHCGWTHPVARRMPLDVGVYGELYVPGRSRSFVKHAMARDPSLLRFSAFAVSRGLQSDTELIDVNNTLVDWGYDVLPFYTHVDISPSDLSNPPHWRFTDPTVLPTGGDIEGYVLKTGNLTDWHKWKPTRTIDAIVVGFKEGRGKYAGLVGSVMIATSCSTLIASVSGMSDETRVEISLDEDSYLGRVCEVSYQNVGDRGRLVHPAFVDWRPDKPPQDCRLDQDPELEEVHRGLKNQEMSR